MRVTIKQRARSGVRLKAISYAAATKATEDQAEAGTDNQRYMTALTTKQSIVANAEGANFLQTGTGAVTRTIKSKLGDRLHLKDFGAVGDGVTDDTAAVQKAIDEAAARGGCAVDLSGGTWLIDSANLAVKRGVTLIGPTSGPPDLRGLALATATGHIILNSTYSIILAEHSAGIEGVLVTRKGLVRPTTLRQALDQVAAFAGTAIVVDGGGSNLAMSTLVRNCMVVGFNKAYYNSGQARPIINGLWGDCTNGIELTQIHDWPHGPTDCQFWDFLSFGQGFTQYETVNVSGAANNGSGLIRITLASPSIMETGDSAAIWSITGTTEANGRWTVTKVSSTVFDLQGSTFTNAYVSGGTVGLASSDRSGACFYIHDSVDGVALTSCFSFGHAKGFYIKNTGPTTLIDPQVDDFFVIKDSTKIGIDIDTPVPYGLTILGGWLSAKGINLRSTGGQVSVEGLKTVNAISRLLQINGGTFSSSDLYATGTGSVEVASGVTKVDFHGGNMNGVTVSIAATATEKTSLIGVYGQANADAHGSRGFTASGQTDTYTVANSSAQGHRRHRRYARGTPASPAAVVASDVLADELISGHDGTNYQFSAWVRYFADGTPAAGKVPARFVLSLADTTSGALTDRLIVNSSSVLPGSDNVQSFGATTHRASGVYTRQMVLIDGVTAPATITGHAVMYIDSADGDLKIKFGDGTVKTIVVDT